MKVIVFCIFAIPGSLIAQGLAIDKDSLKSSSYPRCYPMYEDSKIGISYGILNRVAGLTTYNFIPAWLGFRIMLGSEITWRVTRKGNGYFNLDFTKYQIARVASYSLAASAGYKRVLDDHSIVAEQFYVGPSLFNATSGITFGYARHQQRATDTYSKPDDGIKLQVYKEIGNQTTVTLSSIYWFDQFQYSLRIEQDLFRSGFFITTGFEKIQNWSEFSASVLYLPR